MQNYNNSLYKNPANTLFMGRQLVFMPECHSTNDEAQRLVQNSNSIEGTVVITNCQITGRGQRGNSWFAEPGKNLTFSIVLKPQFLSVSDQIQLTMAISLGLHDWIMQVLPNEKAKIKWPNDLMIGERKVCGILIENHVSGTQISHSIVGIGLNVNQEHFEIRSAASLKMFVKKELDLDVCFTSLLEYLESRYLMLRNGDLAVLKSDYLERLYWIEESRIFSGQGRRFSGVIKGVDAVGSLEVLTDGRKKLFGFKEIEYIA